MTTASEDEATYTRSVVDECEFCSVDVGVACTHSLYQIDHHGHYDGRKCRGCEADFNRWERTAKLRREHSFGGWMARRLELAVDQHIAVPFRDAVDHFKDHQQYKRECHERDAGTISGESCAGTFNVDTASTSSSDAASIKSETTSSDDDDTPSRMRTVHHTGLALVRYKPL